MRRAQVDNYEDLQHQSCPPAVDDDSPSLYTAAVSSWSVLLVLSTLGVLCCLQWTHFSILAIRRHSMGTNGGGSWGEELYTLWFSNLPVTATKQQLQLFMTQMSGDDDVASKIFSSFVHRSGNAFVTFSYHQQLTEFENSLPAPACCSQPWRTVLMCRGSESCTSVRTMSWQLDEFGPKPLIHVDHLSPTARDLQWHNIGLGMGQRCVWRVGLLVVWGVSVLGLFFVLVLFLNLNDTIEAQGYHWFGTFVLEAIGTTSAVTVLVMLVDTINISLGWLQQHVVQSGYEIAMLTQSFFINSLTTPVLATIVCLNGVHLPARLEIDDNVAPRNVSYLVNTLFSMMFLTQVISGWLQLPARVSRFLWGSCCWPGWFCALQSDCCWTIAKSLGAHSRKMKPSHSDSVMLPSPFPLSFKYVNVLSMCSIALVFSPGVPFANIACAVALTHQYWADKYVLLRHSAEPTGVGYSEVLMMPQRVLGLMRFVILPCVVVFAYLWWTRCGPDGDAGKQVSVRQAVEDWTHWAELAYFGIAPGISMALIVLGHTVRLILRLICTNNTLEQEEAPEFQLGAEHEHVHVEEQLRRTFSDFATLEGDEKGVKVGPYERAYNEWAESQQVDDDSDSSDVEDKPEEMQVHVNSVKLDHDQVTCI
eukprot:TRINITY_DN15863_c0_g1_i3.p1 TRINITY_DN15863_c0_g1~~TRINITY_DN15863_c0_g1_i3.p1  ORF type:complete len:647 (+),score=105.43 TRINITY_DN15863_c0_g1_i3:533-2473(+)